MNKKLLALLVLVCSLAMVTPALAVDVEYGGFWRTRAYTMEGFTGDSDDKSMDMSLVDARGRLWTKHILNEKLSWTNRLEFNVIWGDEEEGGGIGTDGNYILFKHSFVDLTTDLWDLHLRIGLQPLVVAKGFFFDDDFAGVNVTLPIGRNDLDLIWVKAFEGATLAGTVDENLNDYDVDYFGIVPNFHLLNDALRISPIAFYLYSKDAQLFSGTTGNTDLKVFTLGADMNYRFNSGNIWGTFLYQTGTAGVVFDDTIEFDVAAYLAAVGGDIKFGKVGLRSQVFYASGDDDLEDLDAKNFFIPRGQKYYWSEIMGAGFFDRIVSNNSPGYEVSNILAANIGLDVEVTDRLTLFGDVWYAELAETNQVQPDNELGTEINLRAEYKVNEHLVLNAVGAYLFAGNATTRNATDSTDAWLLGLQLSFQFSSF